MLQQTLNQWMQTQRAPKRQKGPDDTMHQNASLLSLLESTLADCRARCDDDMEVAQAVQQALNGHQKQQQTFYPSSAPPKSSKADSAWWNQTGNYTEKRKPWSYASNEWWWEEAEAEADVSAHQQWQNDYVYHRDWYQQTATQSKVYPSITELRISEWTMKPVLIHLQTLKQNLTTGDTIVGNIMHINTKAQLEELQSLIDAHALNGSMTLILTDEAKDTPGAYHTRVTAKKKNQVSRQLDVSLMDAITGSRGPWTLPPVEIIQTQVTAIKRVAVRLTAASHFRAYLHSSGYKDTPNSVLASVASLHPDIKVSQISGGKWWSETIQSKVFLNTVIQLPVATADQLVARSGEEGVFACKLGVQHNDQKIFWFPREGKESDEAYHRRLFTIAQSRKEGLKLRKGGSNDLGLFASPQDTAAFASNFSHWCATGFPHDWQQEEALANNGEMTSPCQGLQEHYAHKHALMMPQRESVVLALQHRT
ncbi:unnamed protein product [Cladocopium goreaui]|uniref:Ubiquitin thioesterase L96 n=1 Tax=Cladocopium goreaui TaxID=2562237 RepID=A0A9P1CEF1_9DINO|nr:unnamed protein product [Cladocopium goreaui]